MQAQALKAVERDSRDSIVKGLSPAALVERFIQTQAMARHPDPKTDADLLPEGQDRKRRGEVHSVLTGMEDGHD